ncbi:MAG: hypothetical protein KY469_17525 [Actinobacteria bacterium]|nr:hypothetical protein [Actinomycetota bacterium]
MTRLEYSVTIPRGPSLQDLQDVLSRQLDPIVVSELEGMNEFLVAFEGHDLDERRDDVTARLEQALRDRFGDGFAVIQTRVD